MKHKLLGKIASVAFIVFLVGIIGTAVVGGKQAIFNDNDAIETSTETIKLDGANSVEVDLDFGVGEANVTSGAKDLMEAEFSYNEELGAPEVKYEVNNNTGELEVSQRSKKKFGFVNFNFDFNIHGEDNSWDIKLNNQVPIDLKVNTGVSKSNLDLSGLSLSGLTVDAGVGDSTIDISGQKKQSFDAKIDAGVGSIEIILPKDVGVKVNVDKGVGGVDADGFRIEDSDYVNDLYGKSDVTINIDIDMGVGDLKLKLR
jgi:hypothetical protein